MKRYKVLWIDDEPEKQDGFLESAYLEGLDINYFKTSKLGVDELVKNVELYDAIILDAMGFNETEDEKASLTGLFNLIKTINSLSDRKKIPYFIYSGHLDKDENSSAREMLAQETIFVKSRDNHLLFETIKNEANQQIDTQLRHKYNHVFEVVENNYINSNNRNRLLKIVKNLEDKRSMSSEDLFTPLRKLLEKMQSKLVEIGYMPEDLSLNSMVYFLRCEHFGYNFTVKEIAPPVILSILDHLIPILQDGSHDKDNLNLFVDNHTQNYKSGFLYKSACYQVFEVLEWFKSFVDEHPGIDINKSLWELKIDDNEIWIEGEIIRIAENGWGTFKSNNRIEEISVPPNMINSSKLKENDLLKITTEPSPDGIKTHIKQIQKL